MSQRFLNHIIIPKMSKASNPIPILLLLTLLSSCIIVITKSETSSCYASIISFGDSITDTGNLLRLNQSNFLPRAARPPYGRTFFHRPTGRYSDGRLIIDFIAESLELPFVEPYIGNSDDVDKFVTGVNFAVAGATALDNSFFENRGVYNPLTNVTLGTQLDWFKKLSTNPKGKNLLRNSLILFGEIGGNDYNNPFEEGINPQVVESFAPTVVRYIASQIQELIKLGAKTFLVPGNFPIGCLPIYLTLFETSNKEDYDPETGCITWLNEFSKYHNELLTKELDRIRHLHPQTTIIYADYYNAAMRFYRSPDEFGFSKGNVLKACCGSGGPYNYNTSALCAISPAVSCEDPSSFASWDGIHFTETAYRFIAQGLIEGHYTIPRFNTICPSIISGVVDQ